MRAGDCKLGVAGKIMTTEEAQACLDAGMDFVLIGAGQFSTTITPCLRCRTLALSRLLPLSLRLTC